MLKITRRINKDCVDQGLTICRHIRQLGYITNKVYKELVIILVRFVYTWEVKPTPVHNNVHLTKNIVCF